MRTDQPIVVVVDDDISIRDALRNLLRSVGLQVETFAAAQEYLSSPIRDAPGCLVLDVRMPGLSGLDLQRQLREANIQIPIIFLTAHGDIPMSVHAMKSGAIEFLTKPFRDQELLDAVRQALLRDGAVRQRRSETAHIHQRYESLSAREQEVMTLVLRGRLNKQIAGELGISEATVKFHRGKMMQKMRAASVPELIQMAEMIEISGKRPVQQ